MADAECEELKRRIAKLEARLVAANTRIAELDRRTQGSMMIGPGHARPWRPEPEPMNADRILNALTPEQEASLTEMFRRWKEHPETSPFPIQPSQGSTEIKGTDER